MKSLTFGKDATIHTPMVGDKSASLTPDFFPVTGWKTEQFKD